MTDISYVVRKMIAHHIAMPVEKVIEEASFFDDLACDSLDVVELSILAENEFSVEITDEKLEGVETVGDLIAAIKAAKVAA